MRKALLCLALATTLAIGACSDDGDNPEEGSASARGSAVVLTADLVTPV